MNSCSPLDKTKALCLRARSISVVQILLLVLTLFPSVSLADGWALQNSGTHRNLMGVDFVSAYVGWATADDLLFSTMNGGAVWTQRTVGELWVFAGVDFVDANHGWVNGCNRIYATTNGGASWVKQDTSAWVSRDALIYDMCFVSASTGWAVGFPEYTYTSVVRKTTNGGTTWFDQQLALPQAYHVTATDANHVWVTCISNWDEPNLLLSTNGGTSWLLGNRPVPVDLSFVNSTEGWAVAGFGAFHTTDGGNVWTEQDLPVDLSYLSAVDFCSSTTGLAVGQYGSIAFTSNGGATWESHSRLTSEDLYSISFLDPHNAWAVGVRGTIMHYSGPVPTDRIEENVPSSTALDFFPDPCNSTGTITFSIPRSSQVTLEVFDITGRHVTLLTDRLFQGGDHSLVFDPSHLPSGCYFLRMTNLQSIQVRQIVVLK